MKKEVNIFDVAQYILNKLGSTTTWKLQKLCYYCQAWSLVWDNEPLFQQKFEAWVNGPVAPDLYDKHRGKYEVADIGGTPSRLTTCQRETIEAVLNTYGDKTSAWLSALTHSESPWHLARERDGLGPGERGNAEILWEDMTEYYEGLCAEEKT